MSSSICCLVLRRLLPAYIRLAEMPFVTIEVRLVMVGKSSGNSLTTNLGRGTKSLSYLSVHGDIEVLSLPHLLVPLFYASSDPATEGIFQNGRTYIADPRFRDLVYLLGVRHIFPNLLVATVKKLGDVFKSKAVILRD